MGDLLSQLLGRITSLRNTQSQGNESITRANQEMRAAIRAGETTGDHVKDFLLVSYGYGFDEDVEAKYRALSDRLSNHQSGPVLVGYQRKELSRRSMLPEENPPTHDVYRFELGMLRENPRLDVKTGSIVFPTGSNDKPIYAQYGNRFSSFSQDWSIEEGDISLAPWQFAPAPRVYSSFNIEAASALAGIEHFSSLHLGDEIEQGLKKHEFAMMSFGADTYAEGLRLLGAPLPPAIQLEYDARINREKDSFKRDLIRIVGVDTASSDCSGGHVRSGVRGSDVSDLVERAVRLGMYVPGERVTVAPGVFVEVTSYLGSLCKRHGINLPDTKKDSH